MVQLSGFWSLGLGCGEPKVVACRGHSGASNSYIAWLGFSGCRLRAQSLPGLF